MSFKLSRRMTALISFLFVGLFAGREMIFESVHRIGSWEMPMTRILQWQESKGEHGVWVERDTQRGAGRMLLIHNGTSRARDIVVSRPNDYHIDGCVLAGHRDVSVDLLRDKKAAGRLNDEEFQIKKVYVPGRSRALMLIQSDKSLKSMDNVKKTTVKSRGRVVSGIVMFSPYEVALLGTLFFIGGIICSPPALSYFSRIGRFLETFGETRESYGKNP